MLFQKPITNLTPQECISLLKIFYRKEPVKERRKILKGIYGTWKYLEIEQLIKKNGWRKYYPDAFYPQLQKYRLYTNDNT